MTGKLTLKRILIPALALAVMISMLAVPQTAKADSPLYAKYGKKITVYSVYKPKTPYMIDMGKKIKGAKKITIKSSKSKVAKADKAATNYIKAPVISAGKAGKATLTIKVKKKSGTKTYKCKVIVKKYKNPVKKVKLEGKNITGKFKKGTFYEMVSTKTSGKISVKAKKGWKVKKITYGYWNGEKYVIKKTKNNSTFKYHDQGQLVITMYNKKQNNTVELVANIPV